MPLLLRDTYGNAGLICFLGWYLGLGWIEGKMSEKGYH